MYLDEKIFELKKEHSDVFIQEIEGEDFIFRPLTKYEYDNFVINEFLYESHKAEKVAEMCVLYPEGYNFYDPRHAGVPEILMNEIIRVSGFDSAEYVQSLLETVREEHENSMHKRIENTIIAIFPDIKVKDIERMNVYEITDYYARAEWIINNMDTRFMHPEYVRMKRKEEENQEGIKQPEQPMGTQNAKVNQAQMQQEQMQEHPQESFNFINENSEDKPGMGTIKTLGGAEISKDKIPNEF